ncbi:Permease of the drug/metabolite transporter (DMT) superfamily [Rhizobiales bacterium GAS188]|nr:Permease of the drug/metabolite transporter (DMT) superfamily [Rhizobiales bacterium GAS188]
MADPLADSAVNRRGIFATLIAVTLWTCNDTCGKLASEVFPTGEMMAVRGVFAVALAIVLVVATGHARMLWHGARLVLRPMLLIRASLDAAVVLAFLKALAHMQLANVTAISQATPIIMTLIAAAFGMERIGWRRVLAILVGFSGVLLVVKPTADGLTIYAALAVVSAVLVAVRDLLTRFIDPAIPSPIIALVTAVVGALTGLALGVSEEWGPVWVISTFYLVLAGILVTLGNLAIVIAYRSAEVGIVAPFRYFSIVMALILGYVVFANLPDGVSILGIALIIMSGVYTMHRERVRRLAAQAKDLQAKDLQAENLENAQLEDRAKGGRAAWTLR